MAGIAWMRPQPRDGGADNGVEPLPAGLEVGDDFPAHAGVPEFAEVVFDAGDGGGFPLGSEECADLVGHGGQALDVHGYSAGIGAMRRARRFWASADSCHAVGPLERVTWTAVTLYSGQLVAQSESSVVTTLAWVPGWWKVV